MSEPRDAMLRRLVLVHAGSGASSEEGEALQERRRHWEWSDGVVAAPLRRALESAHVLTGGMPVAVLPGLRPKEARESDETFAARVGEALDALLRGVWISPLVVADGDVIRQIALRLLGDPLPEGRPRPGELVLLTRVHGGPFTLGRRSSDPYPLRSPLEREGLSGPADPGPTFERHVAHLELRGRRSWPPH